MKVLTITPWYPHAENSASGSFVRDLALSSSRYVENFVVHVHSAKKSEKLVKVVRFEDEDLVVYRIVTKSLPGKLHLLLLPLVLFLTLKICKGVKPDVIHAHVFSAGLLSMIIGKLAKIPVAITEHMKFQKEFERKRSDFIRELVAKIVLNGSDIVTVPTHFFRRYLREMGITNRIEVIPNTVNTDVFLRKHVSKSSVVRAVFVGWIDPIKGVDILLRAVRNLKERDDFKVVFVGSGSKIDHYKSLSEKYHLKNHVTFLGSLKREEVVDEIQRSDFLILPSVWEVFGLVVVEAMACGKPVVVSDMGQKEIVTRKTGVVFKAGEERSLEASLKFMIENCRKFPSEHIRSYAVRRFSFSRVGKMQHALYQNLLEV